MTTWLAAGLIFLSWHFATTFFVPASGSRAGGWLIWPFGRYSQPALAQVRSLAPRMVPGEPAPTVALVLAAAASVSLLIALAGLLGTLVPEAWWLSAVVVGCLASVGLFTIYLGPWALLPLLVDAILLWGVLMREWGPASLLT